MPAARDAALRALSLDGGLAEARTALAAVRSLHDWAFAEAEADFLLAARQKPGYAATHQWLAMNLLTPLGRFDEARRALSTALELDPLSPVMNVSRGVLAYYERDHEAAAAACAAVLERDPAFSFAHFFLGQARLQLGAGDDAVASLRRALDLSPGSAEIRAALGHALAVTGRGDEARALLAGLLEQGRARYVAATAPAQVCVGLGEMDRGLELLEQALEARATDLAWLGVRPAFDPLRGQPRFQALLAAIGLPSR